MKFLLKIVVLDRNLGALQRIKPFLVWTMSFREMTYLQNVLNTFERGLDICHSRAHGKSFL